MNTSPVTIKTYINHTQQTKTIQISTLQHFNTHKTYLLTPILPNVLVLDISGRMQALFRLCSGCLTQSSQYLHNTIHFIIKLYNDET